MNFIHQNIISISILLINSLVTISYYIIYSHDKLKKVFLKLPLTLQKAYVCFFILPLFIAPFFSISKFVEHNILFLIVGPFISIGGGLIIILSFLQIGAVPSIKNDGELSTQGMYNIVRHPIYLGTILIELGLVLSNRALIPLLYYPISIILYYIMAIIEEKDLLKIFGQQYYDYKTKTKDRIIPYIL